MGTMNTSLISEAMDCLADAAPRGSRVILFGSHARGDARADSDLDFLVVEPEVADRAAEIVRLSTVLGKRLIPADVVVMSRSAFERQRQIPNTLAYRVAQEGIARESGR
jgi:predicted nucleotidyltransferase